MAIIRAQVAFGADSPAPKDRLVITPHFRTQFDPSTFTTNWQNLADDLAAAMGTYTNGTREVNVKLYDAEEPKPAYPKATKTLTPGAFPASAIPRELALCLSYKAGDGPRRRGRLFVPVAIMNTSTVGLRPTTIQMQKVTDLAPLLQALGGANVDWGVWSRLDRVFSPVQTSWCDDEWDIIRSRGLLPTTRRAATAGA